MSPRPVSVARWPAKLALSVLVLAAPQPPALQAFASSKAHARAPARAAAVAEPRAAAELLQPMVEIPAGSFSPFYRQQSGTPAVSVPAFWLDAAPVSRRSFAEFVARAPRFRRSRIDPLFAEGTYLVDWSSDADPGTSALAAPVGFVSWFAAKAYCAWQGKRLPTVVEWEHAASAGKLSGSVVEVTVPARWEWTLDFNSVPADGGDAEGSGAKLFCGAGVRANDARDYAAFLRYAFRSSLKASYALKSLGLRCAKGAAE